METLSLDGQLPVRSNARPPRLVLTSQAFVGWLAQAMPGHRIEYHRGYLALDRDRAARQLSDDNRRELAAIADVAMTLAERGEIHLLQQRIAPGCFSYIAVKAGHRAKALGRGAVTSACMTAGANGEETSDLKRGTRPRPLPIRGEPGDR